MIGDRELARSGTVESKEIEEIVSELEKKEMVAVQWNTMTHPDYKLKSYKSLL